MKLLATFHQAILDNDASSITPALKKHPRLSAAQQFAIYSDGYRIRLREALQADYPALLDYLGETEFNALANRYIEQTPPTSYSLDAYPYPFAAFVSTSHGDIFAHDLATLESTIAEVFYMPDSEPLRPDALSGLSPETFAETKLKLRTASQLLAFNHPASNYLTAQRTNGNPAKPNAAKSWLLIYRHRNEVQRLPLTELSHALLEQLAQDLTIGAALDTIATRYPDQMDKIVANLNPWFAQWLAEGVFRN